MGGWRQRWGILCTPPLSTLLSFGGGGPCRGDFLTTDYSLVVQPLPPRPCCTTSAAPVLHLKVMGVIIDPITAR